LQANYLLIANFFLTIVITAFMSSPPIGKRITVNGAAFRTVQVLHAVGIVLIPFVGTVLTAFYAQSYGFGTMEVGLLVLFYTLSILGITVGFHRYFAHRSFATGRVIQYVLGALGSMAAQGPLIHWVSNHRRHHSFSDRIGDPHSPYVNGARSQRGWRGFLHAHMRWTLDSEITNTVAFSRDLLRDPVASALNRYYYAWVLVGLVVPFAVGGMVAGSWLGAVSGLLWGGLVRLFLTYHATNSINSLTHLLGSRPFDTRDESRNNAWLVFPTLGEGLHNNHHAFPDSALFGHRWWHFDLGAWVILGLEQVGLVWSVRRPSHARISRRSRMQRET
jgi:stearoyl-CoA desaturase (delta-9 desaturase)